MAREELPAQTGTRLSVRLTFKRASDEDAMQIIKKARALAEEEGGEMEANQLEEKNFPPGA